MLNYGTHLNATFHFFDGYEKRVLQGVGHDDLTDPLLRGFDYSHRFLGRNVARVATMTSALATICLTLRTSGRTCPELSATRTPTPF